MRNTMEGDGSPRVPRRSGVAGLRVVPRWEELAVDPSKAWELDARTIKAHTNSALEALNKATAALNALHSAQLDLAVASSSSDGPIRGPDPAKQWLSVKEAALVLDKSPIWIKRNAHWLPFVHRVSPKTILISSVELDNWLSARKP